MLYHAVESSDKWPKERRKLDLPSLQLPPDRDAGELCEVRRIKQDIQEVQKQRHESKEAFDRWFNETYLASKPQGLLTHLAPKKKH